MEGTVTPYASPNINPIVAVFVLPIFRFIRVHSRFNGFS
jgi:hypothetical protein